MRPVIALLLAAAGMAQAAAQSAPDDPRTRQRAECQSVAVPAARRHLEGGRARSAASAIESCRSQYLLDSDGRVLAHKIDEAVAIEDRKDVARQRASAKREGVSVGMSQQQVIDSSWGKPLRVNRTINAAGTREQWVYRGGYLYFENGKLRTIQN